MAHVLVFPSPNQGHINPMLQFAKRLASKGPQTTLVTTLFIIKSMNTDVGAGAGSVDVAAISDGYDEGGMAAAPNLDVYLASLEEVGARTLGDLIERQRDAGRPFTCMVYDTFVSWTVPVAERLGLAVAAFSTQSCAASAIYYHVNEGRVTVPEDDVAVVNVAGLPPLERRDIPSMAFRDGSYQALTALALSQFSRKSVDWVLFNSFDALESKVLASLKEYWPHARAVGPTVPSAFVDKRLAGDDGYTMNLLKPEAEVCKRWLDAQPPASVVYVSFGSFATLSQSQTADLGWGLRDAGKRFLWVVRTSEQHKLPPELAADEDAGLVVAWSPQLAVLSHAAVGCFVTHCGWNSTLEALSLGVPMVAVPQWTDQPTNAKYVEDVWGVGVRARTVGRAEVARCITAVMDGGERSAEIRRNAAWWRDVVKEALGQGGSSDVNLDEFVDYLNANAAKPNANANHHA